MERKDIRVQVHNLAGVLTLMVDCPDCGAIGSRVGILPTLTTGDLNELASQHIDSDHPKPKKKKKKKVSWKDLQILPVPYEDYFRVFCPEHGLILARDGWSGGDLVDFLKGHIRSHHRQVQR